MWVIIRGLLETKKRYMRIRNGKVLKKRILPPKKNLWSSSKGTFIESTGEDLSPLSAVERRDTWS